MPGIAKTEQFRRLFVEWRGEALAHTEAPLIASAIKISNFADKSSVSTIQTTLVPGAEIFNVADPLNKRIFSSLLYGTLTLAAYCEKSASNSEFATNEQAVLNLILNNLKSWYGNPRSNPKVKFEEFLTATNNWLDNGVLNNSKPDLAKATLLSFYTMLKFIDVKLATLTMEEKAILTFFLVDEETAKLAIQRLLTKIAAKITALEPITSRTAAIGSVIPTVSTIENHINTQCLAILNGDASSLAVKIARIKTFLASMPPKIEALIAEETTTHQSIQAQINHAQLLRGAVVENEARIIGKEYAIALITRHRASVDALLDRSHESVKRAWTERLRTLATPSLTGAATYLGSFALGFHITAYRMVVPEGIQSVVNAIAPATYDSESKAELRALAEVRLIESNAELAAFNLRKRRNAHELAGENGTLEREIIEATQVRLEDMLTETRLKTSALDEMLTKYEILHARITDNQAKLQTLHGLNVEVDAFIAQHHGFFVSLSLLFANICSVFKTDSATKVEEVQNIQRALGDMRREYENAIRDFREAVTRSLTIPTAIKDVLVTQLPSNAAVVPPPPVRSQDDIAHAYTRVKTMFRVLEPAPYVPRAAETTGMASVVRPVASS
jgi:hypothetical protein